MFHAQIESSSQPFRIYIVRNMRNHLIFAHSAPYFVYIDVRYYRLIDRPECNQLSGDICVLSRVPISHSSPIGIMREEVARPTSRSMTGPIAEKGAKSSWIENHGGELRLLTGPKNLGKTGVIGCVVFSCLSRV
jgi:hypothetical protein